jgi:hypothetical protein
LKAVIEGREGFLILDTGAPFLVLNAQYFDDKKNIPTQVNSTDYNGLVKDVKARTTSCTIGTLQWKNEHANVIDLRHLKAARIFPILGLAGTRLFEQYEMIFDFLKSEILLFDLDRSGEILDPSYSGQIPEIILPLRQKGHLPYLEISIGETNLKMGLDTGAEIALIHPKHKEALGGSILKKGQIDILGVGKSKSQVSLWTLYNIKCSFLIFKAMNMVFSDFKAFNSQVSGVSLDGILGTEFMSQFLMAINTKKKELHIWLSNEQESLVVRQ